MKILKHFKLKKIRHKLYTVLSGGLLLSQIMMGVTYYSGPGITSETPEEMIKNIITYTNKERASESLTTLTESSTLDQAAQLKLADMFADNYWDHVAPDGTMAWDFMKKASYTYQYAGENLAKGYHDSGSVVEAWMDSPTHKENILNTNYTEIGVAVGSGTIDGKEVTVIVQLFGVPQTSAQVAETPTGATVLGLQQNTSFDLFAPVSTGRIPYFIAWFVLFALIVFDGIELHRLKLHKSKQHIFEFRSALLINSLAFIFLFINFAAVA